MPSSSHCSLILFSSFSPFTSPLSHPWQYERFICLLSLFSFSFTALLAHPPPICVHPRLLSMCCLVKGCVLPASSSTACVLPASSSAAWWTLRLDSKERKNNSLRNETSLLAYAVCAYIVECVCVLCLCSDVLFGVASVMSPVWLYYRYKGHTFVDMPWGPFPRACVLSPATSWTEFELYFGTYAPKHPLCSWPAYFPAVWTAFQ